MNFINPMKDMSEQEYKKFLLDQGFDLSEVNLFNVSSAEMHTLFEDYFSKTIDYTHMTLLQAEDLCISGSGRTYVDGLGQGSLRGADRCIF